MAKVTKIAISLPIEILNVVEKERKESGESRSRIFCRAIELLVREQNKQETNDRYIRAYQDMPETEDEITLARNSAGKAIAGEPWR